MKGILLLTRRGRRRLNKKEIVYFLHRYGIDVLLGIALLAGMIFGAVCAGSADRTLMQGLDFLFTSDFQSRCSQSVLSAFAASLTANFMFFLANFLLGLSVWGSVGVPLLIGFKGFGTGLSGGYLYRCYSFSGVGFFLLVMLAGCVISTLALIFQGRSSMAFSGSLFARVRGTAPKADQTVYRYIISNSFMLIALSISAMTDAILNSLFAGVFTFS